MARMHELVRQHPRYGYRMITAKLRQEGWQVNFKRIYRLWRREGFKVPRKTRKKRRLGHSGNSCVRRRAFTRTTCGLGISFMTARPLGNR